MRLRKQTIRWGAAVLIVGAIGLFLPTTYTRVVERGTDSFETHRPLFGDRVVEQVVTLERPTTGVGVIAVDLRRSQNLAPIQITVQNEAGQTVAAGQIQPDNIQDDAFAWAAFARAVTPQQVTLVAEAPQAGSDNAIGLRFAQGTDHLSLAVQERVFLWQRVKLWCADNPENAQFVDRTLGGALLAGAVMWAAAVFGKRSRVWWVLLVVLGLGTFALHIPLAQDVEGVFGGDAFNFLLKGNAWLIGHDPFAADPRKGPLFPFLLLPAYLGIDPVWWGSALNLASAGAAAAFTAALAARLGLPRALAVGAGILVAVNREFWWQSVHGLSNIPYALLVLASAYALVSLPKSRRPFRTAVLAGLTFLMRFEGALVGAILLPAVWIRERLNVKQAVRMFVVAAALVLIPFALWPVTGQFGVRTADDLASDGGLLLAYSLDDFVHNLSRFELFWGQLWVLLPLVGQQLPAFGLGFGLGLLVRAGRRIPWLSVPVAILIGVALIWGAGSVAILPGEDALKQFSYIVTFVGGIGFGWLARARAKWSIPILIMVLVQIAVVTAILPKTRYYVQLIPFAALAVASGVYITSKAWPVARGAIAAGVLALAIGVIYADAAKHLPGQASNYNTDSQDMTVLIRAGRFLVREHGTVAASSDNLPLRVYIGDERLSVYPTDNSRTAQTILLWLSEAKPNLVLETTADPLYIEAIGSQPELFEEVATFETRFGQARATVYAYRPL